MANIVEKFSRGLAGLGKMPLLLVGGIAIGVVFLISKVNA